MNLRLTNDDVQSINKVVDYVNDYFKDIWQAYEDTMITRRKNYKRNLSKFTYMSRAISSNYKHD